MSSYADYVTAWTHLSTAITANAASLEALADPSAELEQATSSARFLSTRQAALRAELTQTTKDLTRTMRTGRDLATRLRNGIRSQFGNRSEKLVEFNMRPLRSRQREDPEAGGGLTLPPPPTTE